MYRLIAACLFTTTALAGVPGAQAADLDFDSAIERVLVFPQGAQITRMAEGNVPAGEHVIIIDDLPGNVLPQSVRVKGVAGGSLQQSSIDVRQKTLFSDDRPQERKRLEEAVEQLQFETGRIKRKLADIALQRDMLQALATKAISGAGNSSSGLVSAESLDGLLNSAGLRLEKLQSDESLALDRQNEIASEISDLQKAINDLAPENRVQTVVEINVSADADLPAAFEIEYKVEEAGWQPVYDARLSIGEKAVESRLELLRRASVRQSTGESWDGISLSLSTARPSSATTAPELHPFEVDIQPERPVPVPMVRNKAYRQNGPAQPSVLMELQADAAQEEAIQVLVSEPEVAARIAGFQAVFDIPGKTSVTNSGETKSVTIDRYDHVSELHAKAVPRYDLSAFLMAEFKHEGDTPLLPGTVSLTRDGVYVGQGHLPLLAPGERHELGFGIDDQLLITRVETDKEKGQSGFVSTVNTDRRVFVMTVTNQHDFEMPVRVYDRMPVSNQEDIVVEMTEGSTQPSMTGVDNQRGVLEWSRKLEASQEWQITFGYEVSWPKEMKITSID